MLISAIKNEIWNKKAIVDVVTHLTQKLLVSYVGSQQVPGVSFTLNHFEKAWYEPKLSLTTYLKW